MHPKCLRNLIVCFPVLPVVLVHPLFLELSEGLIVCFPILSICGGAPIVFRAVRGPDSLISYSIHLWWCTNLFSALKGPQNVLDFPQLHSLGSLVSVFLAEECFTLNIYGLVVFSLCADCVTAVEWVLGICFVSTIVWLQSSDCNNKTFSCC